MAAETMFNVDIEKIRKQCNAGTMLCDNNSPIKRGETLEPCIRGAKKISKTQDLKSLVKEILTGESTDE